MRDQQGSDVKAIYFYIEMYGRVGWMRKDKKEEKQIRRLRLRRRPVAFTTSHANLRTEHNTMWKRVCSVGMLCVKQVVFFTSSQSPERQSSKSTL